MSMISAKRSVGFIRLLPVVILLAGCGSGARQDDGKSAPILAGTTIVADVVRNVTGGDPAVESLLPPGTDPHSFEPSPDHAARIEDAEIVFLNGLGLEARLDRLLQQAQSSGKTVSVSRTLRNQARHDHHAAESEALEHAAHGTDPHVWLDPMNVINWVDVIEKTLCEHYPERCEAFSANAENYRRQLVELDAWIRERVNLVPSRERLMVSDHAMFGYFARRYGFTLAEAVLPGFSSPAEPSAKEIARIIDTVHEYKVKAIFVGNTANPRVCRQVGEDTGCEIVTILTGSLTEPGGEADSYLEYMRYNVDRIVNALMD